jgi:prepilin-type N-terminal cleavage/methylation domain-containing protein
MKFFAPSPTRATRTRSGFTMIELLVVTTIIIVLSMIGLVSYQQTNKNARNGKRKADLETTRQALVLYRADIGSYPVTSNFSTMVTTISSYLSSTSMTDPLNDSPYVYSYTSASGATFSICAYLEPDPGTQYCLTNP